MCTVRDDHKITAKNQAGLPARDNLSEKDKVIKVRQNSRQKSEAVEKNRTADRSHFKT